MDSAALVASARTVRHAIQMTASRTTLQRLISVARPELPTLALGLIFLILSSGAGLAYPQIVRRMMDTVLQPKNASLLLPSVLGLFAAFSLQSIAGSLRYWMFTISGERIVLKLRQKLYERILDQEVAFFDFQRTGELMSRLSSDCTTLQNTVSVNISQGLRNLGQVVGGFAFMFYTSWRLSLLMLAILPPVALGAGFFGRRIRRYSKDFQASLAEASIVAEETISGIRTVKSFVQEAEEVRRYRGALDESFKMARARVRAIAEFMTLAMVCGFAAISFVLWFGGRQVIDGQLTVGDLTQFLLYVMLMAIGAGSLGSLWGDMMSGVGASQRIFEILERTSHEHKSGLRPATLQGALSFSNVVFHYPSRPDLEVLKDVSFKVEPGHAVALVGSSGSGKTTIAGLLARFYDPSSGRITLDDQWLADLDLAWLREQIGIVSQEPVLISSTIEDNIRYGRPNATKEEVETAARAANAFDFIQGFPERFQTRVGEKGIQLSGGQKQRVAIARALLKDPRILILDEATSNLDTASEHLVQEALQRLMKGRTTLIIAHRLATIKDADMIFVVDQGRIVQRGRHTELSEDRQGLYYKLLQRQFNDQGGS